MILRQPANKLRKPLNILAIATGDMMRTRARPALHDIAFESDLYALRIAYLDIRDDAPFGLLQTDEVQEFYVQIDEKARLPFDTLNAMGFMACDLAIVGSPTPLHGQFAFQAASIAENVAVDKPLTPTVGEARALSRSSSVYAMSHFLAKTSIQPLWELSPDNTARIEAFFMQRGGVGMRNLDPAYEDLGYHQAAILLKHFSAARLTVDLCQTMTYEPVANASTPRVTTAARITGTVETPMAKVPFAIVVAKGCEDDLQELRIHPLQGNTTVVRQTGDTPKWLPYRRMLKGLLFDDKPEHLLSMAHHVESVHFCDRAKQREDNLGYYGFGTNPFDEFTSDVEVEAFR